MYIAGILNNYITCKTNGWHYPCILVIETDYPPKANAGSDIVIHLPQNSVVLNGNLSTDDKGIISYEWIKVSGTDLTADMQVTCCCVVLFLCNIILVTSLSSATSGLRCPGPTRRPICRWRVVALLFCNILVTSHRLLKLGIAGKVFAF